MSKEKEKSAKAEATELSGEDLEKAQGGALLEFQLPEKIVRKGPVGPLKMDEVDTGPE